jgi:hypothetical protein
LARSSPCLAGPSITHRLTSEVIVVQIVPRGAPRRIDEANPFE